MNRDERSPAPSGSIYTTRYLLYSAFGLLVVVLAAYGPVIANPLLSDDLNFRVFFRGEHLDWAKIRSEMWSGWGGLVGADYYRPVLTWSVIADYLVWGTNPFGYHLTNLLLHTLNALLVAHIIVRLAGPGKRYPALLGALVFALHPIHPEAVAWVAGRVDVLSAFFFLLTIRCYLAYRWTGRLRHLIFSIGVLTLGLGSKESMVMAPFVLLALDVGLKLSRGTPRWAFGARPAVVLPLAVTLAYLALRKIVLGSLSGGQDLFAPYASLEALLQTIKQTSVKLFLLLAPANQEALAPPWPVLFQAAVILMMILPFLALLTHGKRTIPGPLLGGALIVFPLALVGHIHVDPSSLTNSRVLYLPAAGLVVLLYSGPWDPGVRHELRRLGAAQVAVLSLAITAAYFAVLRVNLGPWREAGRIMTAVVRDVDRTEAETPPGRALIVAQVPDLHKGAYVCRNGFLFNLVRPFHPRDIKRVFPVLEYYYQRDPGMLRAVYGKDTVVAVCDKRIWNETGWESTNRPVLHVLPPARSGPHRMSDEDRAKWARLDSDWWVPEPDLERRKVAGGVELIARREGAGLLGPVMRIAPLELQALRFRQDGPARIALGWSTAAKPNIFPSSPVMFFAPHQGWRTISLINHDTWFFPSSEPVGRLRLSVWPPNTPVRITDLTLLSRLPRLPLAFENEPVEPAPDRDFEIPMARCPFTHFKIVILNPAAPEDIRATRPVETSTPLIVSANRLKHLHMVARVIEGFDALLYVDAVEPDANHLTTKARSRLIRLRFPGRSPEH